MKNHLIELIPADPSLAEALCAYYIRNREFLRPFEPAREESFFTAEYQRNILESEVSARKNGTGFRFYIRLLDSPEIIGIIGLNNIIRGAFQSCHLGYKLDEAHRGQGIMPMAVNMIVDYAFRELNLHRIEANVMPRNRASLRCLEKCGFENEGLSRFYLNINGVWEDHIHMVRLNYDMHEGSPRL